VAEPLYLMEMSTRGRFDKTLGGFKNRPRRLGEKKSFISPFVEPAGWSLSLLGCTA